MRRALSAGTAYFLALFALGFVLGAIRVTYIAPQTGLFLATLAEAPAMLIAGYVLCRWAIRRWHVPRSLSNRWAMVIWFIALLALFETLLGTQLFGLTIADQWMVLATPAGLLGLAAQLFAAILPLMLRNDSPRVAGSA